MNFKKIIKAKEKKMEGRPIEEILKLNLHDPYPFTFQSQMRRSTNRITKVFICIRLRPKSKWPIVAGFEFRQNLRRAKIVARYAVLNGYDPEATTIYFTQFLSDFSKIERNLGIKIGQVRLTRCNVLWNILDKGESPSSGMVSDMKIAEENGVPIENKDFSEIKACVKNYDKTPH